MEDLHGVRTTEGWHARYGGGHAAAGGASKYDPTSAY
jgi:tagatose 1,6-diphosphate aldolase